MLGQFFSFSKRHNMAGRPQTQPNYGFTKQLDIFEKCGYEPSLSHPQYRSWKRRHVQDVNNYLNHLVDTVAIVPDKLLMTRFVLNHPSTYPFCLFKKTRLIPPSLVNFQTTPKKPNLFSQKWVLHIYCLSLLPKTAPVSHLL